jgi:hypothetical protein
VAGSSTFCLAGEIEDGLEAQRAVEVDVEVGLGEPLEEPRRSPQGGLVTMAGWASADIPAANRASRVDDRG